MTPDAASSPAVLKAFGLDGLGALTVSNVPGYEELRSNLLPLAQAFAVSAATSARPWQQLTRANIFSAPPSPSVLLPQSAPASLVPP